MFSGDGVGAVLAAMSCRWSEEEIDDAIWEEVKNLLPAARPRSTKYVGRKPQNPRAALSGILFVLRHNLAWNKLPRALGFGCGSACRKRLSGVARGRGVGAPARSALESLARRRADRLVQGGGRRFESAGPQKGDLTGPNPTDRARAGSKHHLLTDAGGVPLAALTSATNRNEVTHVAAAFGRRAAGPRPTRPTPAQAERNLCRPGLPQPGAPAHLGQAGHPAARGRRRARPTAAAWARGAQVVERTFASLHQFKRLRVRYERRADLHQAFLTLGCCVICARML